MFYIQLARPGLCSGPLAAALGSGPPAVPSQAAAGPGAHRGPRWARARCDSDSEIQVFRDRPGRRDPERRQMAGSRTENDHDAMMRNGVKRCCTVIVTFVLQVYIQLPSNRY